MQLTKWSEYSLVLIGVLLIVVPVVGLPLLVKKIIFIGFGLLILGLVFSGAENIKPEKSKLLPSIYQEELPQVYVKPELVPSLIKAKTMRRRIVKTDNNLEPANDHAAIA